MCKVDINVVHLLSTLMKVTKKVGGPIDVSWQMNLIKVWTNNQVTFANVLNHNTLNQNVIIYLNYAYL
jgi:Ser-tRNA(Ala) deacylase AlaX